MNNYRFQREGKYAGEPTLFVNVDELSKDSKTNIDYIYHLQKTQNNEFGSFNLNSGNVCFLADKKSDILTKSNQNNISQLMNGLMNEFDYPSTVTMITQCHNMIEENLFRTLKEKFEEYMLCDNYTIIKIDSMSIEYIDEIVSCYEKFPEGQINFAVNSIKNFEYIDFVVAKLIRGGCFYKPVIEINEKYHSNDLKNAILERDYFIETYYV